MSITIQSRRFHLLAAFALLMVAVAHAAVAREIKYPTKTPVFTFESPEGWNVQQKGGENDAVYCTAKDGSGLNVQFFTLADDEVGTDYKKFAEMALRAGKGTDIEVVKSDEKALKSGQMVKFARSTFKGPGDIPYVSLMVFLPMESERKCVIHCFLPEKQLDAHKDQIEELLNSIKPLK